MLGVTIDDSLQKALKGASELHGVHRCQRQSCVVDVTSWWEGVVQDNARAAVTLWNYTGWGQLQQWNMGDGCKRQYTPVTFSHHVKHIFQHEGWVDFGS
jgi:hypothetical protein